MVKVLEQVFVALLVVSFLFSMPPANATSYNLQVGAFGDALSIGNLGVRAEIRTHVYNGSGIGVDAFWVGDILDNGAFVQFGYLISEKGTYCTYGLMDLGTTFSCLDGVIEVNASVALWGWEYWPNGTGSRYYFGAGALSGSNGTWHLYSIVPNSGGEWIFLLDDQQVSNATFPSTMSRDEAVVAAEKVASSTTPGPLGPVEFRNLSYLKQDGWHAVSALTAIVNCGVNPNCIPIPYGVAILGPNHVIAGSSIPQPKDGTLLWSSPGTGSTVTSSSPTASFTRITLPMTPELFYGAIAAAVVTGLLMIEFIIIPRKRRTRKR